MNPLLSLILYVLAFEIKHFLADFPLQDADMVRGKSLPGGSFVAPLSRHCGIHAAITFIIVSFAGSFVWAASAAAIDFLSHFGIDRWKAVASRGKKPADTDFWILLGFDQLLHHLVALGLAWLLVTYV